MNEKAHYYQQYIDRCWEARQYYKDEVNKLLYWVGTAFLAIVAATGIFGVNSDPDNAFVFGFKHIILFHTTFTIIWLYMLYKQLNADVYEKLGLEIEKYFNNKNDLKAGTDFPLFFEVKGHYFGKSLSGSRGLSRIASCLMIALYLVLVSYPVYRGSIGFEGLVINFEVLAAFTVFLIVAIVGQMLYIRDKRKILKLIEDGWEEFVKAETTP